ncbi:MAG: metallophosphoesterase [Candidatus Bipolaricaulota bacterium]|nr:metallophosphoesterase [Candidatus Bipolaricaulota bacterium]MDW8126533.1 metallophosphoesterase [Candidatus Bipolaricaulota bacterium]
MWIGVISDSHDNLVHLRKCLTSLRERGVTLVLHAGDFVSPFTAEPFREVGMGMIGVFGNNDGDKLYLLERFRGVGEINPGPHELMLVGRRIVLMHEPRAMEALAASGRYDLVIYGHTHRPELREGQPLVLNPGELGGWLSGRATYALVDLETLRAEILTL